MTSLLEFIGKAQGEESFVNGKKIVKIAVLSAWAELYLSSLTFLPLKGVVEP